METTTEIIKINPAEFGIETSKANQILKSFEPLQVRMAELEEEYLKVIAMPLTDVMAELKAAELLKKYVKIRTSRNVVHKQEKDFFLSAGRFVDRIKNDGNAETEKREAKLDAIKNHFVNLEKARVEALALSRNEMLKPFEFDGSTLPLGTMEDNVWISFLAGTKMQYEAKKAEEKLLEEAKVAKEKAEKEEQERIAAENIKLKAEAEAKEKALEIEREKTAKKLAEAEALRKAEQDKADLLLEAQRKQAAEKAKKDKEIADAALKVEREAKEKAETELKAKQAEADAKFKAAQKLIDTANAEKEKAEKDLKLNTRLKQLTDLGLFFDFSNEHYTNKEKTVAIASVDITVKDDSEYTKMVSDVSTHLVELKLLEEKKVASAPQKEKLTKWVESITITPWEPKSLTPKSVLIASNILEKFEAFKKWANEQINTL